MKRISIGFFILFIASLVFTACQENVYMDWKLTNEKWYAIHKQDTGFVTTSTGLCYRYVFHGSPYGRQPKPTSSILVSYKGTLVDGYVFDKAVSPVGLTLSGTIAGWREILPKMHTGDSIILYVPSALAYDTATTNVKIPPHSVLIFNIGLHDSMY